MSALEVGQRVGDYIIEGELGGGGMAVVYRVRHAVLETHPALKVLNASFRVDPDARQRIQARHLDHRNIVKVTNIVATDDVAALVMELVDPADGGTSLDALIAARSGLPSTEELLALALPVLDAIGYAHGKGIIHRDLKPANVLLARSEDGGWIPKVTDFGIAKVTDAGDRKKKSTHAGARMGTVGYSSPEQLRQAKEVTARSDVFSLGALLYELATGKPAFDGSNDFDVMEKIVHGRFDPPEKIAPGIDRAIASAITRALSPTPEARFASCDELAAALRQARPAPVVAASPPASHEAPTRNATRGPLVGAVAVLIVGALGFGIYRLIAAQEPPTGTIAASGPPPADARPITADAAPVVVPPPVPPDAAPPPIDAPTGPWKRHPKIRFDKRVRFARRQTTIPPKGIEVLTELVALLVASPELGVKVRGNYWWPDEGGPSQLDPTVGYDRLRATKDFLVAHGIAEDRIVAKDVESASHMKNEADSRSTDFTILIR